MNIEINPETERLVREAIGRGHFQSVDEVIVAGINTRKEKTSSRPGGDDQGEQAAARRKAGETIRDLRKGVTLDRPAGMSLREYAHIGHKY
jgi:Arc/MetJ-type ribon-helix-helix transcriptional regulator